MDVPLQGGTTTTRTSLPVLTTSCDVAALGSETTGPLLLEDPLLVDELLLAVPVPVAGIGVPGLGTNAAEGSKLVPVAAPLPAAQRGTRTSLMPEPCGSCTIVTPVTPAKLAVAPEEIGAPVPQGGTTTVRAASAVGTTTARMPWVIVLLGVLLVFPETTPRTTRKTSSPSITDQTVRLAPGTLRSAGPESPDGPCVSDWAAIAIPPLLGLTSRSASQPRRPRAH